MRVAGRLAADVLDMIGDYVKPGVTTDELNDICHKYITEVQDAIPALTTFVPDSILLNGVPISDATDGDAGEYDTTVVPTVVVRLGDLTQAAGPQTIEFQVTID